MVHGNANEGANGRILVKVVKRDLRKGADVGLIRDIPGGC